MLIGLSSGMFGIGGALLATPMLKLWLGLPPLLALATPLPAAIPSAISGTIAYARANLVRFDVAWRTLIFAMPMNIAGAYLTRYTSGTLLMIATGLVLVYSAYTFMQRGWGKEVPEVAQGDAEIPPGPFLYISGAIAGFTSGFLAIGGGIVMVPAFVKVLHMPIKQALATSLLCVAALAIPGVIVHGLLDHIDWQVALTLCITVVPMSYLGARLATSLKNRTLERIYGVAMMIFAIYFIIENL